MRQFLSLRCFAQTSKNSSENQPLEQSSCKFPLESLKTAEIWSRFKATPLAVLDLHLWLMKTLFALITLHLHNHLGQMIVGSRFLAWNVQVERVLVRFFWKSFLWIEIPFGRGSLEEVPQRLLRGSSEAPLGMTPLEEFSFRRFSSKVFFEGGRNGEHRQTLLRRAFSEMKRCTKAAKCQRKWVFAIRTFLKCLYRLWITRLQVLP